MFCFWNVFVSIFGNDLPKMRASVVSGPRQLADTFEQQRHPFMPSSDSPKLATVNPAVKYCTIIFPQKIAFVFETKKLTGLHGGALAREQEERKTPPPGIEPGSSA